MHIISSYTGDEMVKVATMKPPFGVDFDINDVKRSTSLVISGSSFNDFGDDYTEFTLYDASNNVVKSIRLRGY